MLQAATRRTRVRVLTPLTGMCVLIALIASGGALADCPGVNSAPTVDAFGFATPEVRRSEGGVLQTTLRACTSTNVMLDQNAEPPELVEFHPPTFEGTIPGPTLEVKPGDKLSILVVNKFPANPTGVRGGGVSPNKKSLNLPPPGPFVLPFG